MRSVTSGVAVMVDVASVAGSDGFVPDGVADAALFTGDLLSVACFRSRFKMRARRESSTSRCARGCEFLVRIFCLHPTKNSARQFRNFAPDAFVHRHAAF